MIKIEKLMNLLYASESLWKSTYLAAISTTTVPSTIDTRLDADTLTSNLGNSYSTTSKLTVLVPKYKFSYNFTKIRHVPKTGY